MPDQLPAQGDTEQHLGVGRQPRDVRAAAELDDGERGTGALDLAGGGGQEGTGGVAVAAEDGRDLLGGQAVAYGQLQRLALLGGRPGGFGPGQTGQFAPLPGRVGVGGPAGRVAAARCAVGQPSQAGPPGQRVQPGPVQAGVGWPAAVVPFGDGEHLAQDGGRRVVLAQDGQTVGEQPVEVGLVPLGKPRRGVAPSAVVRPVCAGGVRGVIGPAAHHPATVGG
ncbi:hypothetical protein [Streptomyces monomycini]|uniref:hypothetical protein n=1 Tax=Streptomyces monomycini TaxID=371720 RepID=UPI001AD80D32